MAERQDLLRLERRLSRALARAVRGFSMIQQGDRVMVAMSGGKDSYALHHLLRRLAQRAPVRFDIVPVHLDQGQPGHDPTPLIAFMQQHGTPIHIERDDTYSAVRAVVPQGQTYCSMCSRLRRAVLYRIATELSCTKIALGHHRDDVIVTLMLNLVFSGQLKAMPPKLRSDDGRHIVIRPLVYCVEDDLAQLAAALRFPILPCRLCGSQPNQERKAIDQLLAEFETRHPGARANMLAALANVRASHLLDPSLWERLGLEVADHDDEDSHDAWVTDSALVRS
ncbi:MAG: tRNA 2-thiocytidine(32) synthetase TtcA [Polyangiaceae bacterium]|jgi:tRNA 2-thiocytidine biosynthesis protein TtcA|nr:tRNA 2-thiocytidine(32) synthetase TtcA [Polyangiaceae bacterium]